MTWRVRLPSALYRRARTKAGDDDRILTALVVACLTDYVDGRTAAQTLAASGGHARAAALPPDVRRDQARHAALARWRRDALDGGVP